LGRWIHASIVYPSIVYARGEGFVYSRLAELRSLEWRSAALLQDRQSRGLAAILSYACQRSPYYHERCSWSGPIDPAVAWDRLRELPFLTKRDLQERAQELLARPLLRRVTRKTTGGSTGEPVTVVKDRVATAREMAASWLGYGWFGVRIGDRAARFWGSPFTLKRRLRFAAADFAMHRIRFSAFAFRPDYFYGYVSMLEAFADHVERRGYDGGSLGLKAIITTSEVVTEPQRRLMETVFRAPIQNEYGCGEVGPIAYECERGGLHIMSENVALEILTAEGRPAEVGETGELVATDLNNRAMPLVRYRLGDFGIRGAACECGRGFPVLEKIWGRAYDFVETPAGDRYHGEFFMYLFEELREHGAGVGQFQITQTAPDVLEVSVVAGEAGGNGTETRVRDRLERALPGLRISVIFVDNLAREASGKMRVIRNHWRQRSEDV
jgi:phenylacetate-CoA ligase